MSLQEAIALQNPVLARTQEPNALFSPYRLGDLELSNRLVMSPMTRSRAVEGNVPNPLAPRPPASERGAHRAWHSLPTSRPCESRDP